MKTRVLILIILILTACGRKELFSDFKDIIDKTSLQDNIIKDIRGLINDTTDGRKPGTRGYDIAAEYIASEFNRAGLQSPDFIENFYQYFSFESVYITRTPELRIGRTDLQNGRDFVTLNISTGGTVTKGKAVFVGYGLAEQSTSSNDYLYNNVSGKIAVMFKDIPAETLRRYPQYKNSAYRSYIAKNHGAKGVIYVDTENFLAKETENEAYIPEIVNIESFPQVVIGVRTLGILLEKEGIDLLSAKADIDRSHDPYPMDFDSAITINVPAEKASRRTMNIMGYIPADSDVKEPENIIFAANLDSLGSQGDVVYKGAVFNCSGTVTLLNLARTIAANRMDGYKANIWFVALSGSEEGLKGAYQLYDTLEFDSFNTAAFISLYGTGASDRILEVGGGLDHPELFEAFSNSNADFGLDLYLTVSHGAFSEGQIFSSAQIPSLFLYGKRHGIKNRASDTADKISIKGIENSVRLLFLATRHIVYK